MWSPYRRATMLGPVANVVATPNLEVESHDPDPH
jgi:hypothetical protein